MFGSISPRTYQIMGVIGATLLAGARPGESTAGVLGRAIGAGMMYDNFANLSEQERAMAEREQTRKEQTTGQQGQLTTARIAETKAQISALQRRLALAERADEREAIEHQISVLTKSIGLPYIAREKEADIRMKEAAAGKPGDTARAQYLKLIETLKDTSGNVDWRGVSRAAKMTGLGKSAPAEVIADGRRRLAAIKDPRARAAQLEQMNSYLIDKGFLPELD